MPPRSTREARLDTRELALGGQGQNLENRWNRRSICTMVRGLVLMLAIALICSVSVLVARELGEIPDPSAGSEVQNNHSIPDLHDVWIPIELLNLTRAHNETSPSSAHLTSSNYRSSGARAKTKEESFGKDGERPRSNNRGRRKQGASNKANHRGHGISEQKDAKESSTPKAEALRTSHVRKPPPTHHEEPIHDNHMTLFSVDSWMGNLSELPQPRVEELKALAAASMRNHQKTHPARSRVVPPMPTAAASRTAEAISSNVDIIQTGKDGQPTVRKKEPAAGESILDEHILSAGSQGGGHGGLGDLGGDSAEFPHDEEIGGGLGNSHPPACAGFHRFYCDYSDDYPTALINQVTKYLKWPLEKLFRDLRGLYPPTLADSDTGNLVCDSITKIIRPGWARNTNGKWLVVINTPYHVQTVTEIKCRAEGTACSYIAPCYHSSCQQRYNIQSLLVIDPSNHYKGPFLSHFLFPSSCVCFVPDPKIVMQAQCQAVSKFGAL